MLVFLENFANVLNESSLAICQAFHRIYSFPGFSVSYGDWSFLWNWQEILRIILFALTSVTGSKWFLIQCLLKLQSRTLSKKKKKPVQSD